MELSADEVALVVEALQDAAFYRDTRSRVVRSAVRKRGIEPAGGDEHRAKARAYEALATRLKTGG